MMKRLRFAKNRVLGSLAAPVLTKFVYPRCYFNPPRPERHIWIEPDSIRGWYQYARFRELSFPGRVSGGNWEEKIRPSEIVFSCRRDNKINSTITHFRDGVPWIETGLFTSRYAKSMDNASLLSLAEEYKKYDRLFEKAKVSGLLPPSKEKGISPMFIHIGPRGEIYWTCDGNHRLGIAIVLELSIPVIVLNRHTEWQDIRDKAMLNPSALDSQILNHPDLADVVIPNE